MIDGDCVGKKLDLTLLVPHDSQPSSQRVSGDKALKVAVKQQVPNLGSIHGLFDQLQCVITKTVERWNCLEYGLPQLCLSFPRNRKLSRPNLIICEIFGAQQAHIERGFETTPQENGAAKSLVVKFRTLRIAGERSAFDRYCDVDVFAIRVGHDQGR
jgi:hypothetical protein